MGIHTLLNEFWLPTVALVLFFLFQAQGTLSESFLTMFSFGLSALLFTRNTRLGEVYLFYIGVLAGFVLEVGFRFLGYQQVWLDASLFGIPYWLPIVWGVGFVLITRLGLYMRGIKATD